MSIVKVAQLQTDNRIFNVDSIPAIVANISALKAIVIPSGTTDNYVEVLGYYTQGDGGGGLFYWDKDEPISNDNGGTIISDNGGSGCWKRVHEDTVNVKWFGVQGVSGIDDTEAFINAIKYMQKGEIYRYNYNYSQATIDSKNAIIYSGDLNKTLVIDSLIYINEPIVITGGFNIVTSSYGAWAKEGNNAIIYTGTEDVAILTTAFYEYATDDYRFITSKTKLDELTSDTNIEAIRDNVYNYTSDMLISLNIGANTSKIGFLFTGTNCKITNSQIGISGNTPDIGMVFIDTWRTTVSDCHFYAKRQSAAIFRCNGSFQMKNIYMTTQGVDATKARFVPTNTDLVTDEDGNVLYIKYSDCFLDSVITEGSLGNTSTSGMHYLICDTNCHITYVNPYQECHDISHYVKASISLYNNSSITITGGFLGKSNMGGCALYMNNVNGNSQTSYINSSLESGGGRILQTENSTSVATINPYGFTRDIYTTGVADIANIEFIKSFVPPISIAVSPLFTTTRVSRTTSLEEAILLCNKLEVNTIKLEADVTLTADIDLNDVLMGTFIIDLDGYTLDMGSYRFNVTDNKRLIQLRFDGGGTIIKSGSYIVNAGGQSKLDVTYRGLDFSGDFWLWGNYRNAMTRSNINVEDCTFDNFTGTALCGTPADAGSIDAISIFVNNKTHSEADALGSDGVAIKNMPNGVLYGSDDK